MIEITGYLGSVLLAICGFPLAYQAWRSKHAEGVNAGFLWIWLIGEILTLLYIVFKVGYDLPLLINYTLNIIFISIVMYYKYKKRVINETTR